MHRFAVKVNQPFLQIMPLINHCHCEESRHGRDDEAIRHCNHAIGVRGNLSKE